MEKKAYLWARTLCHYAGETEEFLADFWERLQASGGVYKEFLYFLEQAVLPLTYCYGFYSNQ